MDIIKNNIKESEIIKWKNSRVINYRKAILKSFIIAVSLISLIMTIVGLFFWFVPSWGGTFYFLWTDVVVHPLIIYLLILSIFILMAIFAIVYGIKLFKRGLRRLGLKLADLSSYQQFHILTNERWIQKDYRSLISFEENSLPSEIISQTKDIVYFDINRIEKVTVSRIRSNYNISFYFKPIFKSDKSPTFLVKLKLNDYQEIKSFLV